MQARFFFSQIISLYWHRRSIRKLYIDMPKNAAIYKVSSGLIRQLKQKVLLEQIGWLLREAFVIAQYLRLLECLGTLSYQVVLVSGTNF
jgi:hypothetical protein